MLINNCFYSMLLSEVPGPVSKALQLWSLFPTTIQSLNAFHNWMVGEPWEPVKFTYSFGRGFTHHFGCTYRQTSQGDLLFDTVIIDTGRGNLTKPLCVAPDKWLLELHAMYLSEGRNRPPVYRKKIDSAIDRIYIIRKDDASSL